MKTAVKLSPCDYDLAGSIVLDVNRQIGTKAASRALLEGIVKAVPANFSAVTVLTPDGFGLESATDFPDAAVIYQLLPQLARHVDSHPFVNWHLRPERDSVLRVSDALALPQWKDRAVYQEFYRPLEVPYQALFHLPDALGRQVAISLFRSHRDFSQRDKAMLEFLRPHFAVAWTNAKAFERLNKTVQAGSVELLWLDGECRVISSEDRGMEWLQRYCGAFGSINGALPEPVGSWVRLRLDELATPGDASKETPRLELRSAEGRLLLRLKPRAEGGALLLLVEEPAQPAVQKLIALGLSPREIEACRWMAEGKSNSEIGVLLGISPRTAEKHVQRILQKLNVENRQAAILIWNELRFP